jgi:hypothetical protein
VCLMQKTRTRMKLNGGSIFDVEFGSLKSVSSVQDVLFEEVFSEIFSSSSNFSSTFSLGGLL